MAEVAGSNVDGPGAGAQDDRATLERVAMTLETIAADIRAGDIREAQLNVAVGTVYRRTASGVEQLPSGELFLNLRTRSVRTTKATADALDTRPSSLVLPGDDRRFARDLGGA